MGIWKFTIATSDGPIGIDYKSCDCFEKYPFKRKSKLPPFLCKCKGWIEDAKGEYSINYLIAIMTAILKERKLITFKPEALDKLPCIKIDKEIQKLLNLSTRHYYLAEFYGLVCHELEINRRVFDLPQDLFNPVVRCPLEHSQEFYQLIQNIIS